jgi:hypothetical protein
MVSGFKGREKSYYDQLRKLLNVPVPKAELYQTIVDAPFRDPLSATYIELSALTLWLVDPASRMLTPATVSDASQVARALKQLEIPFADIRIPIEVPHNFLTNALGTHKKRRTDDWADLLLPVLSPQSARLAQAEAGVISNTIAPLRAGDSGVLVFHFFNHPETPEHNHDFVRFYTSIVETALNAV